MKKMPNEMTDAEFERWLKKNKITGLAAFSASRTRKRAQARKAEKAREAEQAGKALGEFMRERRDLLEAQEALLGSAAPITLTPEARRAIATTLKRTLDFVPGHERRTRDAIRQWLEILVPEME